LDEGIAASSAERALAGNNMPQVVTMPAYRAETTLERTVADITAGITDRLILVDASPDNSVELARALGIDVHIYAENLGYGGN
jgi:glycosyltransferase involved in cell wall biosynthesis